jgi:hypothetical protein
MPNQQELHDFRQLLEAQAHDPLAAIVTHYGLKVEVVGFNGTILPIVEEFEFVEDRILQALYSSKEMMHGSGPAFSNVQTAMEILEGRYMSKREKLEEFCKKKIFAKIAYLNGFYEPLTEAQMSHGVRPSNSDRKLNIPKLEWKQKLNLVEDSSRQQMIIALRNSMGYGAPGISMKTIYNILGINEKEEIEALRSEGAIVKELQQTYGMSSPLAQPGGATTAPAAPAMPKPQAIKMPAPDLNTSAKPKMSSLKRREGWSNSESLKEAVKSGWGVMPTMARPPVSFLEEGGRLAKLEKILDKTEKELSQ